MLWCALPCNGLVGHVVINITLGNVRCDVYDPFSRPTGQDIQKIPHLWSASLMPSWIVPCLRQVSGYVGFLLNHLTSDALGGLTTIEVATAHSPNISALLSNFGGWNQFSTQLTTPSLQTVLTNLVAGWVFLKPKVMHWLALSLLMKHRRLSLILQSLLLGGKWE